MAEVTQLSDGMQKVCYTLSTSVDTSVFGPTYWEAFHDLASRIPCVGCKEHAESFMRYWHDLVNVHTGKPVFDQANFNKWNEIISNNAKRKQTIMISVIVVLIVALVIVSISKK